MKTVRRSLLAVSFAALVLVPPAATDAQQPWVLYDDVYDSCYAENEEDELAYE